MCAREVYYIERYFLKVVKAGNTYEVSKYEHLNVNGGGAREGDGEFRDHNYKNTQRKRRNMVRQLVTNNFDNKSKFITLTFKDKNGLDVTDVKECNKIFHNFINRVRRRYSLQYLAVIEFQDKNDRGAVHYHMISNLTYVPFKELLSLWGHGGVRINAVYECDNLGAYVIKYMNKDLDDKRLQGLKAYNCSKGLKKPLELKSWESSDVSALDALLDHLKEKSPSYVASYESETAGSIEYLQYNFNRK